MLMIATKVLCIQKSRSQELAPSKKDRDLTLKSKSMTRTASLGIRVTFRAPRFLTTDLILKSHSRTVHFYNRVYILRLVRKSLLKSKFTTTSNSKKYGFTHRWRLTARLMETFIKRSP